MIGARSFECDSESEKKRKNLTQDELHALKRKLYQWAKENLRGTSVKNEEKVILIEISTQGINEWFSKSKSEEQIKSILLLPQILQKSKFTHSEKNIHSENKNAPRLNIMNVLLKLMKKDFMQLSV